MTEVVILDMAKVHIEDIYVYTYRTWGSTQADDYLDGLYTMFDAIAGRSVTWRSIPQKYELDIEGYFAAYGSHFVYWRVFSPDEIGIFAVLHQSRDLGNRLTEVLQG